MPGTMTFETLEAFYADDEARRLSPEWDFGVWWYPAAGTIPFRCSWVKATGEMYAIPMRTAPLAPVRVIGKCTDETTLENALSGWAEECGKRGSLQWIERVMAALE